MKMNKLPAHNFVNLLKLRKEHLPKSSEPQNKNITKNKTRNV